MFRGFTKWLVSEPIGVAVMTSLVAINVQNSWASLRNLSINKALANQSKLSYNAVQNIIQWNVNKNDNAANRYYLEVENTTLPGASSYEGGHPHVGSDRGYFTYIIDPHVGWTLVALGIQLLVSFILAYLIYVVFRRLGSNIGEVAAMISEEETRENNVDEDGDTLLRKY